MSSPHCWAAGTATTWLPFLSSCSSPPSQTVLKKIHRFWDLCWYQALTLGQWIASPSAPLLLKEIIRWKWVHVAQGGDDRVAGSAVTAFGIRTRLWGYKSPYINSHFCTPRNQTGPLHINKYFTESSAISASSFWCRVQPLTVSTCSLHQTGTLGGWFQAVHSNTST